MRPDAQARVALDYRADLRAVLSPFVRGGSDPATLLTSDGSAWRACRTPDGPATLHLVHDGRAVAASAWGPGADWLLASVPDLLGSADDPAGFPADRLPASLAPTWQRLAASWRVPRSRLVVEALVIAVLEQKVTGVQSRRAWRSLLVEAGAPAPGPTPRPMHVMPGADEIRRVPSWQWHRWGVSPHQSATIMRALATPGRLEQVSERSHEQGRAALTSIPGIAGWTAAEVAQRALGDPDAVSIGDFHLAHHVVYAFTGRTDGTDEDLVSLLAPFAGHRYRVQRIVEESGIARPARGPRMTIADHRRH